MLAPAAAALANHLLGGQPWLRERLMPFAGRTLAVKFPLVSLALTVGADGAFGQAALDAVPDAVATVSPSALFDLLARQNLHDHVELTGDAAFAAAVAGVLQELRWDVEEDLSHLVGDIPAHRFAQTGRSFFDWHKQALLSIAAGAAEYWTEEQPLLATRAAVEQFVREVDALREDVERVEKRIDRLSGR
jgi:ubiquinone biosynthesis protein UbiJ